MALPVLQQNAYPGSPGLASDLTQREVLAAARRAQNAKRRAAEDGRRPSGARRQSLRRVKDSKEQLRSTRARGTSNATIESSTTSTTAGRSFTVANINNGIIYLRYVLGSFSSSFETLQGAVGLVQSAMGGACGGRLGSIKLRCLTSTRQEQARARGRRTPFTLC